MSCGRRSESALIRRGAENWHIFCRELLAARVRSDGSLSTPQAAGGSGQRPAFTGICRPLKSAAEIGGVAASHVLLTQNIQAIRPASAPDKRGFSPPATGGVIRMHCAAEG